MFSSPQSPAAPAMAALPQAPPPPPMFGMDQNKPGSKPKGSRSFNPTFLGGDTVPQTQQLGGKTLLGA